MTVAVTQGNGIESIPGPVLFYGATGWIGGQLVTLLPHVVVGTARLEDHDSLVAELTTVKPSHVVLAAGLTGRPNIDWCEDHQREVTDINVIGPAVLASQCWRLGIHLTYFSTGCVYEYDDEHPIGGKGFTEDDPPNFRGSFYSRTKTLTEDILKVFDNVLVLRIRMPISSDLHSRSFMRKILNYPKVVNVPNSISINDDLIPLVPQMMANSEVGVWNFVNPGVISHNEILDLYREMVDPAYTYVNFTLEEQAMILKAGRSNCCLDPTKLVSKYPIPDIHESLRTVMTKIAQQVNQEAEQSAL